MFVSDVRCSCQSVTITDKNFKMSRHVAGRGRGSGGPDPSEILKVTFMNRVNLCTFCGGVGVGICPLAIGPKFRHI